VCSYYEIEAALRSKYLPKNIIFVGPAKSRIEIEKCLEVGVYAIVSNIIFIEKLCPLYYV